MKKLTILMSFIIICYSGISQNRGTFLKETFDGTSLPSGWSIDSHASNWSISNSNNAGGDPCELRLVYSPSWTDKTRVISPVINTTGATELVIDFLHYLDFYSGSHLLGIETTSDGGATWNTGWQSNYSSSGARHVIEALSTPDVGSATFQFCLFYSGYVYNINYWYFDNFELYSRENLDASLTSINNAIFGAVGGYKADFTFFNKGITTINSMEVEYQFGDLPPVVETFTALNVASLASKTLSFSTETYLLPDNYDLKVNILKVNGVVDDDTENNSLQKTVNVSITEGQRKVCIEHFTSSSCPPCVNVNAQMKTLLENPNNAGKFSITKYQVNWPGVGDPYYTAEVGVRVSYYGVTGVPSIYWNSIYNYSPTQTTFNNALAAPAFIDISGNFNVTGTTVTVNFDVASYLPIPSARVYAIVNEKKTTGNTGPNGELEFFHVMMKMLPDAQGTTTSFDAGEIKSFTFTQNMAGTHVEEMSDLEVHVFVQEYDSKYIFNSNFLAEYTNTQLNPPGNLALQDNGNGTVAVTWSAPITGTPTGYNIYLNNELIQANHSGTSYTATLANPVGYQAFKVNAVYAEGVSVSIADYLMICDDNEPPTNLNAEQINKDVILTWTAPDGSVDYYTVYYDGNILQNGVVATTYTHVKAPSGEHTYGVAAVISGCGTSEIIETDITVTSCSDSPESFSAIQEGADVVLTWVAPADGVDYYNVYLDGTLSQGNITETTYTLVQAPLGTHEFGLTSVTNDCESDMVKVTLEVTGDACDPPTKLDAVQEDADVVLTWTAPANEVDSYNVYLDGTLHKDNITETTYTVVDAPEGTHVYGVTAIVGECESEIVEKELTITGISEPENAFRIFPNPADDYVQITGNYIQEVLLYNLVGQVVEHVIVNDNSCRIETSKLNSGIYFIKIYSLDNQTHTRKIVIR